MGRQYTKEFKEEAVKLSDEIGLNEAVRQLGVPYQTLSEWRKKRSRYGERAIVGSGHARPPEGKTPREIELEKENAELKRVTKVLQDALGFFAETRRKQP